MSILPASGGTQKLWITSSVSSRTLTVRPTGTWTSLADTTCPPPGPGYVTSHHHRLPVTRTVRASAGASTESAFPIARPYASSAVSTTTGNTTPPPISHVRE